MLTGREFAQTKQVVFGAQPLVLKEMTSGTGRAVAEIVGTRCNWLSRQMPSTLGRRSGQRRPVLIFFGHPLLVQGSCPYLFVCLLD